MTDDYLLGDLNEDGIVDARDLTLLKRCVITGDEPAVFESGDLNADEEIDETDVKLMIAFLTGKSKKYAAS